MPAALETLRALDWNGALSAGPRGRARVDQSARRRAALVGLVSCAAAPALGQTQDLRKAIVWPGDLAPAKPRFPTPPWNRRRGSGGG